MLKQELQVQELELSLEYQNKITQQLQSEIAEAMEEKKNAEQNLRDEIARLQNQLMVKT